MCGFGEVTFFFLSSLSWRPDTSLVLASTVLSSWTRRHKDTDVRFTATKPNKWWKLRALFLKQELWSSLKYGREKKSNKCQKRTKLMKETSEHVGAAAHLSGRAVQGFLDRGELRADELLLTQLLSGLLQVLARLLQPETSNHIYSSIALTVQWLQQ